MTRRSKIFFLPFIFCCTLLAQPGISWATQAHGAPEGIIAHQLAHVFFIFSMGILIYWLRERNLVVETPWRYIQYAAMFFIFWNVDTILAHLFDEQLNLVTVTRIGLWDVHIDTGNGSSGLIWVYYLLKLDHLLCVPALGFLLAGLRRLVKSDGIQMGEMDAK
jgi:hypothetical protein